MLVSLVTRLSSARRFLISAPVKQILPPKTKPEFWAHRSKFTEANEGNEGISSQGLRSLRLLL
jgi:hypothetical protein